MLDMLSSCVNAGMQKLKAALGERYGGHKLSPLSP
jgi:hypothetical protein